MTIDWKAFYANGGYSNENSDPQSYDDGLDDDDEEYDDDYEYGRYDDELFYS